MVAHRLLDQAGSLRHAEPFLGLALELRIGDEDREHRAGAVHRILAGDLPGLADVGEFGVAAQALDQGGAEALFVAAALGRRHRIDVGMDEALFVRRPGDRPFDPALAVERRGAGEGRAGKAGAIAQRLLKIVADAAGKADGLLLRQAAFGRQSLRRAAPADLDPADQVGLGPGHPVQRRRAERHAVAEDFRVGMEAHRRAAPVVARAGLVEPAARRAPAVALGPQAPVARHLDLQAVGQRVHDRQADAVQPAGGGIGLAAELAAGMQGRENDLEGGLVPEFRMRIGRDAAAVVADGDTVVRAQRDLDAGRVAGGPPRPSRCRSPRPPDGAGRARPCRRYTCPGACGPAPALRGPRYRARYRPACAPVCPRGCPQGFRADLGSDRPLDRASAFASRVARRTALWAHGRFRRIGEQVRHCGHGTAFARCTSRQNNSVYRGRFSRCSRFPVSF